MGIANNHKSMGNYCTINTAISIFFPFLCFLLISFLTFVSALLFLPIVSTVDRTRFPFFYSNTANNRIMQCNCTYAQIVAYKSDRIK